jgi:mRNA-degrading endonuclease RelE of RelBE toxin-antitoxin system
MNLRRPYIEDVLEVLNEIHNAPNWGTISHYHISSTRIKAVQNVARRELIRGRFVNFTSADRSIHDACTRRLNINTEDLDGAIRQWQNGHPEYLQSILFKQPSITSSYKNIIDNVLISRGANDISPIASDINEPGETQRIKFENYRIIRDTFLAREIKKIHKNKCQICSKTLMINTETPYAEAHHIKPLGAPHNGPDVIGNIICVCPNCHAILDYGGILLDQKNIHSTDIHKISSEYMDYHNSNIFNKIDVNG